MKNDMHKVLRETFGFERFRPFQQEVIEKVLAGNDSLVIMPTGGGKSLCYQVPALLFDGLTIVVSPLISLMKDQVEQLRKKGVKALFLNSSLTREEYAENVDRLKSGGVKLLYVAPETLLTAETQELLPDLQIACLTIDEAHCISEWGHDFRPEYRQLAAARKQFPEAVCLALTATATPRVQEDIRTTLQMEKSETFVAGFDRENLFLQVVGKEDPLEQILDFLYTRKNRSGIIYCFSRRQVDELYRDLRQEGYRVAPYHAGLRERERSRNQEAFTLNRIDIIVATVAFGMGIDKPDVRFVVHHDMPQNPESYYQQIGRAGRDGLRSDCLLLYSRTDTQKINYFINKKEEREKKVAREQLEALTDYLEVEGCRRASLMAYFGEEYGKENCGMCDNCVARGAAGAGEDLPALSQEPEVLRKSARLPEDASAGMGSRGSSPAGNPAASGAATAPAERDYRQVGMEFNTGKSLERLAGENGVKKVTILSDLKKFMDEGNPLSPEYLLRSSTLSQRKKDAVFQSMKNHGPDILKRIYDDLSSSVDYNELRLMQLYFKAGEETKNNE